MDTKTRRLYIIVLAAFDLLIDRRIEHFAPSIETHEIPYCICKIAPELRQSLLIVCSLEDTLRSLLEIHCDGVIFGFKWIVNHIIRVAFNFDEQVMGIK